MSPPKDQPGGLGLAGRLVGQGADVLGWIWARLSPSARRRILSTVNHRVMIGVVGLIEDDHGRILLLEHRFRAPYPWGLPGGFLARGEAPAEGLVRELREEVGLELEVEAGPIDTEYNVGGGYVSLAFAARPKGLPTPKSAEISKAVFVDPKELPSGTYPHHRQLIMRARRRDPVAPSSPGGIGSAGEKDR